MLQELHIRELHDVTDSSPQVGLYYAVVYEKSYYRTLAMCWKVVILPQLSSSCTPLAQVPFDWPQQDDLDSCHDSSILFYGPVPIVGNQAIYNTAAG